MEVLIDDKTFTGRYDENGTLFVPFFNDSDKEFFTKWNELRIENSSLKKNYVKDVTIKETSETKMLNNCWAIMAKNKQFAYIHYDSYRSEVKVLEPKVGYERRLEIETLPPEEGWNRWQAVIGFGSTTVYRSANPDIEHKIWVFGVQGPREVEAKLYQNWKFEEEWNHKPLDKLSFFYTEWFSNSEYKDYYPNSSSLDSLCDVTREGLVKKVRTILKKDIKEKALVLATLRKQLKNYV